MALVSTGSDFRLRVRDQKTVLRDGCTPCERCASVASGHPGGGTAGSGERLRGPNLAPSARRSFFFVL